MTFLHNVTCGSAVATALFLTSAMPAAAVVVTGVCGGGQGIRFAASDKDNSTTTSGTFVTLPEATVPFTTKFSTDCVMVHFSAWIDAKSRPVFIRAFLNNTTAALPLEVEFSAGASANERSAASFFFVFPSIPPGNHTLRIQYRSGVAGQPVNIKRHNTIVYFGD
jgi:hypothetical protein